jgi:uncharacterized protein YybS (DUF2232 family)
MEFLHELAPRSGDDGYARGKRALVVTAVLTALAAVIVGMRLFARLKLMKATGLEDWAILISTVFSIIYLALVGARMIFTLNAIRIATNITPRIPVWNGCSLGSAFSQRAARTTQGMLVNP